VEDFECLALDILRRSCCITLTISQHTAFDLRRPVVIDQILSSTCGAIAGELPSASGLTYGPECCWCRRSGCWS